MWTYGMYLMNMNVIPIYGKWYEKGYGFIDLMHSSRHILYGSKCMAKDFWCTCIVGMAMEMEESTNVKLCVYNVCMCVCVWSSQFENDAQVICAQSRGRSNDSVHFVYDMKIPIC